MLRFIRITLAIASILAVTLLFVDVTGTARACWPWMAKIQFIPAVLSVNLIALAVIVLITLIAGRVYCSVICPLGIFQDVMIRLRSRFGGKKSKNRFHYRRPATSMRLVVLAVFTVLLVLGLAGVLSASIAGLIEPYSAYGRMASQLMAPVTDGINNVLADNQVDFAGHSFMPVIWRMSLPVMIIAVLTLVVITIFALVGGREYCNRLCPVGTILGYLSKLSIIKIRIDTSRCNGCRKCERNCKSQCIDFKTHSIDYSRCVVCMNCIGHCRSGAIYYGLPRKGVSGAGENCRKPAQQDSVSQGRRSFILTASALGGAAAMYASGHGDGSLAPVKEKQTPPGLTPVTPPGSGGYIRLAENCTACQLCIQNCPNNVLVADTSLTRLMQPTSTFTLGWCRPECTTCGDVCPTGAIVPLTVEEKSAIKTGSAEVALERCISAAYGQKCGNCARKCPTGAVTMEPMSDAPEAHLRPVVDPNTCIGCGACQYNCPVGTAGIISDNYPAIYVNGLRTHMEI